MGDYKDISQKLIDLLSLDKSPVAVKLFESEDEAKTVLSKTDKATHCQHVFNAAKDKKDGYATINEQKCPRGSVALGLSNDSMKLAFKLDTPMEAVGYAPLEDATFKPDAILIYGTPLQALTITQKYTKVCNERFLADFSGKQSLCADAVTKPYITKESNLTLGCNGSRGFTDIKPEELIISLTLDNAEAIVNAD